MAKIAELKKYLTHEFSSGSYTGEDYRTFQTKYINYLKAICRENHWQLVNVGKNHYCFSAFIKSAENKCIYISISDVRYFMNEWYGHILIQKDGKTLINKKTLAGFLKYACDEAKKQAEKGASSACIDDDTVYGWAVHYFEEDSIEGTLYNEDGTEYKAPVPKVTAKTPTVKPQPKPQPKPQMSMFDLLDAKPEDPVVEEPDDEPTDEDYAEAVEQLAEEEKRKPPERTVSPMYQKYLDAQGKYPHAVVAMRLGDFYEVFGKNAETLADEPHLTLTGRDCGLESRVPMVGFPYHTAEMYFGKILSNGHTLVVMENNDEVRELPAEQNVDLETGEILSEEEMREFDGDIEEPDLADYEPDISAFDTEALAVLDEMFGNEITLR